MNLALSDKAARLFHTHFGTVPEGVAFAPGRVNLIGEHVDYNDGLVLPMPVAAGTAVAWVRSDTADIEVLAADFGESDSFSPDTPDKLQSFGWRSYVRGMVANWEGQLPPLRLLITGDLPRGSGLSSSASLCIALGRAFSEATGTPIDQTTLARQAQRTEHEFAGVACGIMDQMAVAAGAPAHAMLLDCRDLLFEHVAIPRDWSVLIVDSGVTRGLVDGEYNARRSQCEEASRLLGVPNLREATTDMLRGADLPEPAARRARHVVEEIARVQAAADLLVQADLAGFGALLREGHASLRDLFEVSVPAVDRLVAELDEMIGPEGGARMTGAGFGGSVVAVTRPDRGEAVLRRFGPNATRVV